MGGAERTRPRAAIGVVLLSVLSFVAACGDSSGPSLADLEPTSRVDTPATTQDAPTPTEGVGATVDTTIEDDTGSSPASTGHRIVVDTSEAIGTFDRRMLGTNVPAWLSPDLLADQQFIDLTTALGTTVLRLPGGSWSNYYDWVACENGDPCPWAGVARPQDFLRLLLATGAEGMWTVNVNSTPQEAAALVAYFNGEVGDDRPIGVDRTGRDWGTVSRWARKRAAAGQRAPVPIHLWEVGNEVYAAKGEDCAEWGWEDVWTCDGTAYVNGIPGNEGYLAFRDAMQAVDPAITVGAVGVEWLDGWGNWGNEIVDNAGEELDFYSIHFYPFSSPPPVDDVLEAPSLAWPKIMDLWQAKLDASDLAPGPPVAVTEYNIIAAQDQDADALMSTAMAALFTADSVGQMTTNGVTMANHWDLANGRAPNGSDYGMIDVETVQRTPPYFGLAIWREFGTELLGVRGLYDRALLGVYAARDGDGFSVMVVNRSDQPQSASVVIDGAVGTFDARVDVVQASSLDATEVTFNGSADPSVDLTSPEPTELGEIEPRFDHEFPPLSVSLIRMEPS